jgi:hypothetical protein
MDKQRQIAKVVTKTTLKTQSSDFEYWSLQPPSARLEALESIRQEYHRWKYGAEPRLQRVYSIIKR